MKSRVLPDSRQGRERGQSIVELGLLLPLLLLILLGTLDLARVYFAYVSLQNASREGARFAADHPTADTAAIAAKVNQELANTGITGVSVSVACSNYSDGSAKSCSSALMGDRVKVSVSYPFLFITTYIFGVNAITLSTSTVMAIAI